MVKDATWLVFILIIILAAWSIQYRGTGGPVLWPPGGKPPVSGTVPDDAQKREVEIRAGNAATVVVDKEYIIIRNSGDESITLSGSSIHNQRRESVTIGLDSDGNEIVLARGERAVIATGRSPLSGSFKINSCSRYFAQNKTFVPSLSSSCPQLSSLDAAKHLESSCRSYIDSIPSCQFPEIIPTNISSSCNELIQKHAHYQGCVADHKNDAGFDKKEWRIYLNRTNEFWYGEDETIELRDASGTLIGSYSY